MITAIDEVFFGLLHENCYLMCVCVCVCVCGGEYRGRGVGSNLWWKQKEFDGGSTEGGI